MVTMGLTLPVAVDTAVIFLTAGYSHVWRENGWARLSLLLFGFSDWTDFTTSSITESTCHGSSIRNTAIVRFGVDAACCGARGPCRNRDAG